MKKNKQWVIALSLFIGLCLVVYLATQNKSTPNQSTITSFEDCLLAGYPIRETYPRQCATEDGRLFAEVIQESISYNNASTSDIVIDLPFPGAVTGKTFTVTGKARGYWFFEASFPITIIDSKGDVIVQTFVQATGDWMTENFVPFAKEIEMPNTYTGKATILIMNDNPSGLPENEKSLSFPITIEY